MSMPDLEEFGRRAAEILWRIEAVSFRPEDPFTFTSGRKSPVYIDCRRIISFVPERRAITEMAVELMEQAAGKDAFDAVAGGETAGIPFAAWIAEAMDLPMLYVRKKAKGFGRMAQIEGDMPEDSRVLLVEDLATDAGSKLMFANVLREAGAEVAHCFVVFHYGIFPASVESLRDIGITLHALATWRDVLAVAREKRYFDDDSLGAVEAFLDDPEGWQAARA